jgi:hypothetical protein
MRSELGAKARRDRSVVDDGAEVILEVTDELIELLLARTRGREHELSTLLGEHGAESLARFADPFDQNHELTRHSNFSLHERNPLLVLSIRRE